MPQPEAATGRALTIVPVTPVTIASAERLDTDPAAPAPTRRRSQAYWVAWAMKRLTGSRYCCGCLCLGLDDRRQLRRVFRLVRGERKSVGF